MKYRQTNMISIITGDIINSRESNPEIWLKELKAILNDFGNEPKQWEIFRGDSFQLEVQPKYALKASVMIKSAIKQFKKIDVRLAIGIGEKTYASEKITESNGSAFVNSGKCFEQLKKSTLGIKSPFKDFDKQMNVMLELAMLTMNNWTPTSSTIVMATLKHPTLNQKQIADILGKTQSNISEGLKRAGYDEILKLIQFYNSQIQSLC